MEYTIRGHQDAGVQACAKHYIGNEQETHRSNVVVNGTDVMAISSNIDDRVLRELYLWPFSDAVRAGTASVMCSYNRLNQTYACENDQLLNKILKDELGFRGYVVSDFFATHSGVQSIEAGLDMTMPGPVNQQAALLASTGGIPFEEVPSYFGQNITSAVTGGLLNETRLDDMIRRVMTPYYHLRQDEDFPDVDPSTLFVVAVAYGQPVTSLPGTIPPARDVRRDHAAVIRNVASAGTVLLKNQDDILPIRNITNVAVFGNAATDVTEGLNFMGYDYTNPDQPVGSQYGPLLVGGGSGSGRAVSVISPLQAIRERSAKDGFRLQYVTNNDLIASGDFRGIFPAPEICLVFLKTFSTENWDRLSFENDWNSTLVVENAARICPNSTVVITHSSGVNTLPWNNKVAAILAAHYPGEQSGNSIVDVLWGDVNPSGHLPYTIPKNESDYEFPILNITGPEALNSNAWQTNFTEGLYIDYRHFDAHDITPLYPFGHGLSYTTFSMAKTITVQKKTRNPSPLPPAGQVSPGGNPHLWDTILTITVCLSNDGSVRGAAVPQLYVSIPTGGNGNAPDRTPVKVLRGFEKVDLGPGKSAKITFQLTRRDLSFWSVDEQEWRLPRGAVAVHVGFSAGDIRVSKDVQLM
jgi:beta-glucosidase